MESTWPEAHRRDGDPQPPQFRSTRDFYCVSPRRGGREMRPGEGGGEKRKGFKQCRDSTREHETRIRVHMDGNTCASRVYAHARDCVYAESYLPRLKSHREGIPWQECLGNSLGARNSFHPATLLPQFHPASLPPPPRGTLRKRCIAVCRCIVSIFTQGRRAGGLLFPRFSSRLPLVAHDTER